MEEHRLRRSEDSHEQLESNGVGLFSSGRGWFGLVLDFLAGMTKSAAAC